MRAQDLGVVKLPYVVIAMIVMAVMMVLIFSKLPNMGQGGGGQSGLSGFDFCHCGWRLNAATAGVDY